MSTESSPHNLNADAIDRIQFSDIFDAENIQRMQDLFSTATGVASIITSPDGSPLTRPSNFCRLCNDIIRKTEAGLASCYKSDCIIGSMNASSAAIQPCLGCGLWDAGTRITVGGRHIANWMIGQVRNEQLDDQKMVKFADEIGVNREDFLGALQEVPVMQFAQFEKVTEMLVAFAGEISEKAYANYLLKIQIRERDKAADMLKKSEERFSLAMDATTDGLWDGDVVTGKVYYSPGYFRILGYEPNEFEYNLVEWQKMIHPDDLETALANNNACLNNEIKSLNVEYRMKAKDGSWRWILDRGKVVERDADGKALRMIGTHVDITERRKTDDMLRDERQLLRTLIDNIPDTIYAKDLSYRKTLANLAEMKFTGAKSETDVLGKDDFDLYPGALAEKFHADDQLVFETGMPLINKEGYVTDVNGNQRWMLSSKLPLKDKSGRVTGLVGIGHDITERKTAEEALLESEEKYRLIFENSPMGLLYYDEKGVIVACNTGFAQIIGTSVEKLVGLNMLILPDKKMVSAIRKSIEGETALFEGTYQSVTANKISKGRALFAPIKFTDGRIRGGVGIIEDITERRLAEEALLQSQERARLQRNAIARIAVDEGISSGNYKNFFQRLTEIGAGAIQIARVSIWLLKNNRTELWCESLYESHSGNHSSGAILKILDFPTYFRAIDHESRISANDAVNDLRTREFASDYLLPNQISSMLDAGIYVEGELMGVVCLEHTGEKRNWHPDEEAFASTLAAITAQALANAKRRLFEEALRVSEEKYRSIFENVQDVFFQTDLSGRILEISPSITRFSGYERADVIGTKVSGLYFNPDNQEELVDTIKEKQELRDYELRLITKSGLTKYISVNASLVPGADGIPQYIEGSVRDISERKQAAEELNERKEKYRGLSEATFEAIFISEKGLCIEQNLSAEKMFGYTSEEAIGRLGTEWMVPEDREMIM
ncbi:MAG: PAS domain S-box protein, partial [Bacteroidota bacterium]